MARILIVEDIPDNAELAQRILSSRGHDIIHAIDAESGLDMALAQLPDLILLDLGLPDHDGLTLASWLRAESSISQVPIIAYTTYDIELERSLVALQDGHLVAVAMLGLRNDRAWITRLGVLPNTRRGGVGQALREGLLEQAETLGVRFQMLEVIKNNVAAHSLLLKLGFYEVGELLVLRRSPIIPPPEPVIADAQRLDRTEALDLVGQDRGTQPWTNQSESLSNAAEVSGPRITLADGSEGWLVYQRQRFLLTRFAFKTPSGNAVDIARAFLSHLHHQYPRLDTQLENIQVNDPHLPAFYGQGYVESFRRTEMWRGSPPANLRVSSTYASY